MRTVRLPQPTRLDRTVLWLNLVPIVLSAAFRAIFWLLEINMAWWFCRPEYVTWGRLDLGRRPPESREGGEKTRSRTETLDRVRRALEDRRACTIPHSGARPFTDHIQGVANLLEAWGQPEEICMAGLLHSVYSTEMFPWTIFKPSERQELRDLVGADVEQLVFLYCTCSQQELYRNVSQMSACQDGTDLSSGFRVRNFYTGEQRVLDTQQAARLLVILAADLMEQDPFFSEHMPCACLRLAAPYLDAPPPLFQRLKDAGFYEVDETRLEKMERRARTLLRRARRHAYLTTHHRLALGNELTDAAQSAPWLYELRVEGARLASSSASMDTQDCVEWCRLWGTRWSTVASPCAALEYVGVDARQPDAPGPKQMSSAGVRAGKSLSARARTPRRTRVAS